MRSMANFEITADRPGEPLVITDLGPWSDHPTVTNDAERVVAELVQVGLLPVGRRLHYFDSEGELSELLVRDGRFAGFAPVREVIHQR